MQVCLVLHLDMVEVGSSSQSSSIKFILITSGLEAKSYDSVFSFLGESPGYV